jgi:hypothetical protein
VIVWNCDVRFGSKTRHGVAVCQPLAIRPPKGAGVFATEFSRLVFLESRIASSVVSIGGELGREAGGPRPLRHLV